MKPRAFLESLKKGAPKPGYLFLGSERFFRGRCRRSLVRHVLGEDGAAEGLIEIDLKEQPLAHVFEEARTLSLFATARLVVGRNAEAALPRARSKSADQAGSAIKSYFRDPTPGVVVLFEATRFDLGERDDKAKAERAAKFFAAVPETVELTRLTAAEALKGASALSKRMGLDIDGEALAELVDLLGADMARLENDLEKLAVYAGESGRVTRAEIELLVPEARQSGVFELSDALAHKDRRRALEILDTLAKSGAYWPLQITLLASLLRQALAARELGARGAQQLVGQLAQRNVRIWNARAQQLIGIARTFSQTELEDALVALFEADRDLRRPRPDDRIIMERLVLRLTN